MTMALIAAKDYLRGQSQAIVYQHPKDMNILIIFTILFCIIQSQWIWHLQDKYPDNDGGRFIKEYGCIYDFEE